MKKFALIFTILSVFFIGGCTDPANPNNNRPNTEEPSTPGGIDPITPGENPGGEDPTTPGENPGGEDPTTPGENPGGEDPSTPGENPGGSTSQTEGVPGWFEVPQINDKNLDRIWDSDASLYRAYHLCAGGEKGANGKTTRNYTVCFSATHHCPVWVAAPRHALFVGGASRTNAYQVDPDIPSDIQYNSKSTGDGCNKGHMLGSAERTSSSATNTQVFYYTNIAPQLMSGFNTGGGGWNLLEDWVDSKVCVDTLYEVVGCYFDEYKDAYGFSCSPKKISFGGRRDVSQTTMFYYILLRTKAGNSGKSVKDCSAHELMCAAFVRTHTNSLKGQKPSSKEMMSVADLEKITGFS